MKRLFKLLATSVATLAVVGLLAISASADPQNSEPLDEDPDDNADREQVDISAEEILLIDVRDVSDDPTSDDEKADNITDIDFTQTSSAANAFDPQGNNLAAGDRYAEARRDGAVDITANVDDWTLEVCNGGNGGDGNWLGGNTSGNSRGFDEFTEAGIGGDQDGVGNGDGKDNDGDGSVDNSNENSASFLALHAGDFSSSMNDTVIAQGPNASSDHPTWDYLQDTVEDGTDCDGSTSFTYTGGETGNDGIADEDFQGPSFDQGVEFEYVFGYDVFDGTFGADTTTVLWTLSEGSL